jgi:hypothetical protein
MPMDGHVRAVVICGNNAHSLVVYISSPASGSAVAGQLVLEGGQPRLTAAGLVKYSTTNGPHQLTATLQLVQSAASTECS